ncbi:hypothetical protein HYPSUDRAFT_633354 [Hypholoma sublateritium FD-334 SS-4]|uniref:Uncharacterized protein n=1 Tax=Hypholoma sublateritium (strain FD-334 SS-4) TaxID=945553 RepID=A0A0D2LM16_HYPSF|nr:hypothetical protein HYPSUDRAFT_633354 [Hypholoma sublateritium FD-334 SS-4]
MNAPCLRRRLHLQHGPVCASTLHTRPKLCVGKFLSGVDHRPRFPCSQHTIVCSVLWPDFVLLAPCVSRLAASCLLISRGLVADRMTLPRLKERNLVALNGLSVTFWGHVSIFSGPRSTVRPADSGRSQYTDRRAILLTVIDFLPQAHTFTWT